MGWGSEALVRGSEASGWGSEALVLAGLAGHPGVRPISRHSVRKKTGKKAPVGQ